MGNTGWNIVPKDSASMGSMRDSILPFAEPRQQSRNKHQEETLRRTVKKAKQNLFANCSKSKRRAYVLFEVVSEKLRSGDAVGVSVGEDGELETLEIQSC